MHTLLTSIIAISALSILPGASAFAHDYDHGRHRGWECERHHHHRDCVQTYRYGSSYNPTYIVTPAQPVTVYQTVPQTYQTYTTTRVVSNYCNNCGVIVGVHAVNQRSSPSGLGAVTGAVVGGVLGNQIGGGTGRQVATVAGAIGGGVVGNEIERNNRRSYVRYDVQVRMDHGGIQTYSFDYRPNWRRGERVWLDNGQIHHRR